MKKIRCFLILFYFISNHGFAQTGNIDSFILFPPNPTNVDSIYVIADLSFDRTNCSLVNSYSIPYQDSVLLHASYCLGNITSNCYSVDTFNLGVFSAGNYSLDFHLSVRPFNCNGPAVTVDYSFNNLFTVGLFTSINVNEASRDYSLFPNPTHNSEVNIKTTDPKPFSISCFNNIGMLVFEMNNLTGNQKINLPEVKGIYFIKITDNKSLNNTFKCVNY